jgi:hypothetical protein
MLIMFFWNDGTWRNGNWNGSYFNINENGGATDDFVPKTYIQR